LSLSEFLPVKTAKKEKEGEMQYIKNRKGELKNERP
jgi:hypothetical protein